MHSLAPKNWFQNDIEIQIRHVSPPSFVVFTHSVRSAVIDPSKFCKSDTESWRATWRRDQGYRVRGGILSTSQYLVNTFGYISETGAINRQNKTRLRLDQLGLSLLRGLHVCFVSFEGLTHAKQRKVADWSTKHPFNPNTKLPRAALVVAAWARPAPPAAPAHTCNHRPSPINDGWRRLDTEYA